MARKPPKSPAHLPDDAAKTEDGAATGSADADGSPHVDGPTGDVAIVVARDERGTHILRRRSENGPVEAGVLQPLREGKPIDGEVVSLRPRADSPAVFDVQSELPGPQRPTADGPAQVASDAYRRGWDAVWGTRRDRTLN